MSYDSALVRTKSWGTEILTATDLHAQLDLIINWAMASQDATTGHDHSGAANHGPKLTGTSLSLSAAYAFTGTFSSAGLTTLTNVDSLRIVGASALVFEGATDNAFETTVTVTDPTADRTLTIPDETLSLGLQCVKGWVTFDGTGTPAIDNAHNVTSITDNGVGDYWINWTVAFSNTKYCVVGSAVDAIFTVIDSVEAGRARIAVRDYAGIPTDSVLINVMAIGVM